jgi:hypothetical protein
MQNNSQTITVEIMGGLGNQLFQMFTGLAYSLQHKIPFYFPAEPIQHGERKKTYWHTPLLQTLQPFIKAATPSLTYNERQFHYQALPPPPPSPIKFFGYFQSYKYFQDQQDAIFRLIRLRENQDQIREKIQHNSNSNLIAIHFRVGDYKNLPNHHPLMTLGYYTEALKQLLLDNREATQDNNSPSPHNILYFCEEADQDYIQKQMILPLKKNPLFENKIGTFQCIDHKLEDWEQVLVMSLCQKHIIANSTFSWWGAYLSEEKQSKSNISRQIYYPTTWFGTAMGNKNMADMFPSDWHRINV